MQAQESQLITDLFERLRPFDSQPRVVSVVSNWSCVLRPLPGFVPSRADW